MELWTNLLDGCNLPGRRTVQSMDVIRSMSRSIQFDDILTMFEDAAAGPFLSLLPSFGQIFIST